MPMMRIGDIDADDAVGESRDVRKRDALKAQGLTPGDLAELDGLCGAGVKAHRSHRDVLRGGGCRAQARERERGGYGLEKSDTASAITQTSIPCRFHHVRRAIKAGIAGRMEFAADLVESYAEAPGWGGPGVRVWRHGSPTREPRPHRMPAHWFVNLIVQRCWDAHGAVADVSINLHGPITAPYIYAPGGRVEQIGLAVAPERAASLIGGAAACLADAPHESLPHAAFPEVMRMAVTGRDAGHVAAALLESLRPRADRASRPDRLSALAARWLRRSGGRLSVGAIAERLELSARSLNRRFTAEVGIGPKAYARMERLNAALRSADRQAAPHWASLAAEHGFADQAHLARDFRELVGASPAAAHAQRRAD